MGSAAAGAAAPAEAAFVTSTAAGATCPSSSDPLILTSAASRTEGVTSATALPASAAASSTAGMTTVAGGSAAAAARKDREQQASDASAAAGANDGRDTASCVREKQGASFCSSRSRLSNSNSSNSSSSSKKAAVHPSSTRRATTKDSSNSRISSRSSSLSSRRSSLSDSSSGASSSSNSEEEGRERTRNMRRSHETRKFLDEEEEEDSADEELLALPPILCLFCTYTATAITPMLDHMRQQHGLDLATRSSHWRCLPTKATTAAAAESDTKTAGNAAAATAAAAATTRQAHTAEPGKIRHSETEQSLPREGLQQQEQQQHEIQQREGEKQLQKQEQQEEEEEEAEEGGEMPVLTSYRRIALINFLRSVGPDAETRATAAAAVEGNSYVSFASVSATFASLSASSACWKDPQYLRPVVADDRLLWECCCSDSSSGSSSEDSDDEQQQQQRQQQHHQPQQQQPDLTLQQQQFQTLQRQLEAKEHERRRQEQQHGKQNWEQQEDQRLDDLERQQQRQQRRRETEFFSSQRSSSNDGNGRNEKLGAEQTATGGPERTPEERSYFSGYSEVSIHREMIADRPRTEAYRDFILNNADLFRGKVVLDVGCGSGILSIFCAQAGAAYVIGVDGAAGIARLAQRIVAANGFSDRIQILSNKLEDVELFWETNGEAEDTSRRVKAVPRRGSSRGDCEEAKEKTRRSSAAGAAAAGGAAAVGGVAAAAKAGGRGENAAEGAGEDAAAAARERDAGAAPRNQTRGRGSRSHLESVGVDKEREAVPGVETEMKTEEKKHMPYQEKLKVDVIVSEWMGYGLLFESMIYTVLHARDEYLRTGGLLVPSHVALGVAAADYSAEVAEQRGSFCDQQQTYGLDLRLLHLSDPQLLAVPEVRVVDAEKLVSPPRLHCSIDLYNVKPRAIERLRFPFHIPLLRSPSLGVANKDRTRSDSRVCPPSASVSAPSCGEKAACPARAKGSLATSLVLYFDCFFERQRPTSSATSSVVAASVKTVCPTAVPAAACQSCGSATVRGAALADAGIYFWCDKEEPQQPTEKPQLNDTLQDQCSGEMQRRGDVLLSTSPCSPPTHWKQTLLHLLGRDRRLLCLRPEGRPPAAAQQHDSPAQGLKTDATDTESRKGCGEPSDQQTRASRQAASGAGTLSCTRPTSCTEASVTGDECTAVAGSKELRGVLSISPGEGDKRRSIVVVVELYDVPQVYALASRINDIPHMESCVGDFPEYCGDFLHQTSKLQRKTRYYRKYVVPFWDEWIG